MDTFFHHESQYLDILAEADESEEPEILLNAKDWAILCKCAPRGTRKKDAEGIVVAIEINGQTFRKKPRKRKLEGTLDLSSRDWT